METFSWSETSTRPSFLFANLDYLYCIMPACSSVNQSYIFFLPKPPKIGMDETNPLRVLYKVSSALAVTGAGLLVAVIVAVVFPRGL